MDITYNRILSRGLLKINFLLAYILRPFSILPYLFFSACSFKVLLQHYIYSVAYGLQVLTVQKVHIHIYP
jgi:hypothetical protein